MNGSRRERLEQRAKSVGLYVATQRPGNGTTLYRFIKSRKPVSYYHPSGLFIALGLSEAETWLAGYMRGKQKG